MATHSPSQVPSQQNGSMLQTRLQQVSSAQLGEEWALKQLPASGSPHSSQISAASAAHASSQSTLQQFSKPGVAHTWLQQPGLSQPGVRCATKQLPVSGSVVTGSTHRGFVAQRSSATSTQAASQVT